MDRPLPYRVFIQADRMPDRRRLTAIWVIWRKQCVRSSNWLVLPVLWR